MVNFDIECHCRTHVQNCMFMVFSVEEICLLEPTPHAVALSWLTLLSTITVECVHKVHVFMFMLVTVEDLCLIKLFLGIRSGHA